MKRWLRQILGLVITIGIFAKIFWPVYEKWPQVREHVLATDFRFFVLAAAIFAAFLFVFRALSWWRILLGFGHRLPIAPMTRIWSTSELARYLPGVIWQVVGRVYLVRPYGVSGSVCSTSQVLELVIFLLANIVLGATCLLYLGVRKMDPAARPYLFAAMSLVPVLLVILHPRIFYGIMNRIMRKLGKPLITRRLPGRALVGLVLWSILGLLVQSFAIWLVTSKPLGLPIQKWWMVACAYCLAWCGGFLAFWAPGGFGVRELIFVYAMRFALPEKLLESLFPGSSKTNPLVDIPALKGFLAFLGVLLRLWATLGELMLASLAYLIDYRGALGRADAPGRVAMEANGGANVLPAPIIAGETTASG